MKNPRLIPASIAVLVSAAAWASAPVFIRYLSRAYDPYSQALVRYGAATIALLTLSLVAFRGDLFQLLRHPGRIFALALVNIAQQYTWTMGCYGSVATTAQLLVKFNVVFVIIFSYFLYREERTVIRSPLYLSGTAVSFIGGALVLSKNPASLLPVLDSASIFVLLAALLWAVYIVWAKHLVANSHPVPTFTVLAIFTTTGFVVLSLLLGDPYCLVAAGPRTTLVACVSGFIPIATAHPCFYYAQKHLGSALCSSILLLNPLITYLFALPVLPDESLTWLQWTGAAILMIGMLFVTFAGHRAHSGAGSVANNGTAPGK